MKEINSLAGEVIIKKSPLLLSEKMLLERAKNKKNSRNHTQNLDGRSTYYQG